MRDVLVSRTLALAALAGVATACGPTRYVRMGPPRTVDIVRIATFGNVGSWWDPVPRLVLPPAISSDALWAGYVVRVGDQFAVEVNGRTGKAYAGVFPGSIRVSPGGGVAYVAIDRGREQFAVVNGTEESRYESIDYFSVSADGSHHVYRARLGGMSMSGRYMDFQFLCVADGEEGPPFDYVGMPVLSADGKHFAYAGRRNGRDTLLVDGHPVGKYDYVTQVALSADGSRVAVVAGVGKAPEWHLKGQLFGLLPGVPALDKDVGKHRVVLDGVKSPEYDWANPLQFSADGRRLAYTASSGGEQFVVVDGVEQPRHRAIGEGSFRFSPDSRRFCYGATHTGGWTLVVDGKEHPVDDVLAGPYFSPDSRHVAYVALERGNWQAYVDDEPRGQARPPWWSLDNGIPPPPNQLALTFSPDSEHIAYLAMGDAIFSRYVAIDGTTGDSIYGILPPVVFVTPRRVRYFTHRLGADGANVLERIEEALPDEPAPAPPASADR